VTVSPVIYPADDEVCDDKSAVAREVSEAVKPRLESLGCELASFGIRDVILPGERKELLNKVTEARKAAEANVIARREETAAIRSQPPRACSSRARR
jgi:regulator of protease activity HflC (stomatin/prohibitin superfamily)